MQFSLPETYSEDTTHVALRDSNQNMEK